MANNGRNILLEITDPRGISVILYEDTWEDHITFNHPEMEDKLHELAETVKDPDWIREGRVPETEELYVKARTISNTEFSGTLASTRMEDGELVVVTTSYEGNDSEFKGKMKWSKNRGDLS